jgi:hypothetical protein
MKTFAARRFAPLLAGLITFSAGTLTGNWFLSEAPTKEPSVLAKPNGGDGPAPAPTISREDDDDPNDLGCWGNEADDLRFGPIRLQRDRILTTICGTLFVKDAAGNTVWRHNTYAPLTDAPKLINGELVVVGYDLHLLALDATTGEQHWEANGNGRASYTETVPVGTDMYAVLVDMSSYENCFEGFQEAELNDVGVEPKCVRQYPDRIWLRRGPKMLREWEVPAGSRIRIDGTGIFAVYRHGKKHKRIELRR